MMKFRIRTRGLRPWAVCLAGAMAMLAGCSRDEGGPGDGGAADVDFRAGIATRTSAGGSQWETTDAVGIFMLPAGGEFSGGFIGQGNSQYKPDGEGRNVNLVPSATPLQWTYTGSYDFVAYYPWSAENGRYDAAEHTYKVDVTAGDADPDVLYARKDGVSYSNGVDFNFSHVMSKVRVNLYRGALGDAELASLRVDALDMPTVATLSLEDGTLADKAVGPLVLQPLTGHDTKYAASLEAIVVPQSADEFPARKIIVTVGTRLLMWEIPDSHILEAGKVRHYDLEAKADGLKLINEGISEWEVDQEDEGVLEIVLPAILEESNSYMLEPNNKLGYLIPVSQANKVLNSELNLGADIEGLGEVTADNYTVELVWGDTPVEAGGVVSKLSAYYKNGQGYVWITTGQTGNAVVAIRDNNNNIRWSWHIWVTDEVGFATDNVTGLTWMDRNLGAAGTTWNEERKNGLYYQWGRKDAFPDASGSTPATNSSYNTLSQLVQNPGVFTTNNSYSGSVPDTPSDTNPSWGESGQKTIYDPCPPGWRVPPIQVGTNNSWGDESNWDSFVNYGRIFKGVGGNLSIYFPAAGYRYCTNGVLTAVGSQGYYWSATVSSQYPQYASTLRLHGTTVYPISNEHRGYGFSVRCVAE